MSDNFRRLSSLIYTTPNISPIKIRAKKKIKSLWTVLITITFTSPLATRFQDFCLCKRVSVRFGLSCSKPSCKALKIFKTILEIYVQLVLEVKPG